ncbi:MAG: MMPL family transporter [Methylacidiphilales bacterium]|nr:MMPL family transporter [Candidatus Methylacidiphilales bacterium]
MIRIREWLQALMRGVARFTYRHPWWVIGGSMAVMAAGIWLSATRLGVLNDTNALIRQDSPVLRYYLDYLKEFNTKDPTLVVVESDSFEQNRLAVEALAARIQKIDRNQVRDVYYRNDLTKLKPHFMLFQKKEELETIRSQIETQRELLGRRGGNVDLNTLLDGAIEQFNRVDKARGKKGTLDDLESYADKMVKSLEALALELSRPVDDNKGPSAGSMMDDEITGFQRLVEQNEYLSFRDGKMLLITITPGEGDANSFSPYEKSIAQLKDIIAQTRKEFPSVKIGMTGEFVLMDEELRQSTHDSIVAAFVAVVLLALLFFFSYHELVRPALAIYALIHAIFWSLGFTVLAVGHLNIISQAFVLMLLGLGIDFSIQVIGRYEEERASGLEVLPSLENTLQFTGVAILTSGGTTAAAFYTMCFNDFIGLAEMGIIAGTGILCCLFASLVLYPALIAVADRRMKKPFHARPQYGERGRAVDQLLVSRPVRSLVLIGVGTVLLAWLGFGVKFDYNLLNLQNQKIEPVQLARHLGENPELPFMFGVIVAGNMDEAARMTTQLEALPTVASVSSPTKILPDNQEAKLKVMADIRRELNQLTISSAPSASVDLVKAKAGLATILQYSLMGQKEAEKMRQAKDKRIGQALRIFDRLLPALQKSVNSLNSLSEDEAVRRLNRYQLELIGSMQRQFDFLRSFNLETPVTLDDLPPQALAHYISPNGKILLEINPKENVMEQAANERFVADLRKVSPQATGTPVQNYTYITVLKDSYVNAAVLALLAIVVMVSIHFRHAGRVLLSLLPLGIGIIWTAGIMGLAGLQFNPANIITLPLVIGIGVAYGVYVVDRHEEEGRCSLFGSSTGKAILLSALATMIGFGSMMIGDYKGLVSLGLVMSIGIFCVFSASVLVLPQILFLMDECKALRHRDEQQKK